MALWDRVSQFLALQPVQEPVQVRTLAEGSLTDLALRAFGVSGGPWRTPTIKEALSVPAIQRAVSLIASTTGMLSVQGFRNGVVMDETPRLIARPDPYHTPGEFYSTTAADMAKAGEFVWLIASRDIDGLPAALINVPLTELVVEPDPRNRLLPIYTWSGDQVRVRSTRFSAGNPAGQFVHVKYPLADPFDLRGKGPLQLCGAATSVTVEAQHWAANFYAKGGHPSDIIKHAFELDPTLRDEFGLPDPDNGLSEADRLKAQYVARDNNTPLVIDQRIESINAAPIDPTGAQMLEARQHQNGDAARMFGIPGSLLEYQQPGASLTYQNLEGEFTKLIKVCLQPLYLEPIEQALSDLLPRSTVARFNVKGFLRADIKTRFEVHGIAIDKGIYDQAYAQREEGIAPGDVEFAPVLYSPPAVIPERLPIQARTAAEVRCGCGALLAEMASPPYRFRCRKCKRVTEEHRVEVRAEVPEPKLEVHAHFAADMFRVESPVTVHQPDIHVEPTFNAPEPAPLTVQVEQPESAKRLTELGEQLSGAVERMSSQQSTETATLHERISELAHKQDELAAKVAAPPKPRQWIPERNEHGQIVKVTEAA